MTTADLNREERLDRVIADYLRALQEGWAPSREKLFDTYPDLADDLSEFFADQDRFKRLAAPLRQASRPEQAPPPIPRRFGNYELLEEIARGGMGVVYRARQFLAPRAGTAADQGPEGGRPGPAGGPAPPCPPGGPPTFRLVALKFLLAGSVASESDLRRFRTEIETVARLDHPRIVPVYEVGAHEGLWFLSMKLIEGGHLGQYRDHYRKDPRAAVKLLAVIADAVHHAHQRGILHRDLKPSNILMERRSAETELDWLPYISDFGLARQLPVAGNSLSFSSIHVSAQGAARPAPITQPGDIVGTPSYMAPEQASGKGGAVTVAADVYGLGAILYELLTGRPPFQAGSHLETILQVLNQEPLRPRQLAPRAPRDLETITLKCLQKEPTRRYGSARELADDLRRWLAGEPIQARPVGSVERLVRWVRRQPVVAALVLALGTTLPAGLALTGWQWYRAEQHLSAARAAQQQAEEQREEAHRQAQSADVHFTLAHHAVNEFTSRVNEELEGTPGLQEKRRRLLASGLKYYEQFLKERGRTAQLVREQADTWVSLAEVHSGSGERDKAAHAYSQALALYRELYQREPNDRLIGRKLAGTLNNVGSNLEDLEKARLHYQESLEMLERLLEDVPAGPARPPDPTLLGSKGITLGNLAVNSRARGQVAGALAFYEQARRIQEQLVRQHPRSMTFRSDLAGTVRNLAVQLSHQGKPSKETLALFREVCDLRRKLADDQPDSYRRQSDLGSAYLSLSIALRDAGDLAGAKEPLQRALEVREKLVKENPGVPRFLSELAHACDTLGVLHSRCNERGKALVQFERGRDLLLSIRAGKLPLDPSPRYREALALAWFNIGACRGAMNQRTPERQAFQQSRELLEELVKNYPDRLDYRCDLGRTLSNLGLNLGLAGRKEEALLVLHQGLEAMRPAFEKAPQLRGYRQAMNVLLGNLGEVERALNHPAEAVAAFQERQKLWPNNPQELYRTAREFMRTASCLGQPGQEAERQRCWDLAMASLEEAVKCGWSDAERLRKERDLEPLRGREDFQRLLAVLQK